MKERTLQDQLWNKQRVENRAMNVALSPNWMKKIQRPAILEFAWLIKKGMESNDRKRV